MNTPRKGSVRYIVFKDQDIWYAVALEFNIIESADDSKIALINLFDAIQGYVESCQKIKGARVTPLNQKVEKEYEGIWKDIQESKESPFQINTYGVAMV